MCHSLMFILVTERRIKMLSFGTLLAQASETGDGAGVIGFLVIVGFLWAICAACNKKPEPPEYDVYMKGRVKPR